MSQTIKPLNGNLTIAADNISLKDRYGSDNSSTWRTTLGVAIGSDVQAFDDELGDIAGIHPSDGVFIVGDGSDFVAKTTAQVATMLGTSTPTITTLTAQLAPPGTGQTLYKMGECQTTSTSQTALVSVTTTTNSNGIIRVTVVARRTTDGASGIYDVTVGVNNTSGNAAGMVSYTAISNSVSLSGSPFSATISGATITLNVSAPNSTPINFAGWLTYIRTT